VTQLFEQLDPRTRILTVLGAIVVVASTPNTTLGPFAGYGPLALLLVSTGRAPGYYLVTRCLAVAPFVLLAAGLLVFQAGPVPAASVALKGFTAAFLLAFLTFTTPLSDLLWGLRHLKAPESLNLILGMMYRYTSLLSEEYSRLERARDSRTTRPLGRHRFAIYGRQFGTLILRSWDRAERVHAAMLSRGFTGAWPVTRQRHFSPRDAGFLLLVCALFFAARWLP